MLRHVYLIKEYTCTALPVLSRKLVCSSTLWDKLWDYFRKVNTFLLISCLKLKRLMLKTW
uniref:Uncharacterized protein n=1 Tax=Rhizophora mucronata TaxID=61149 RepID=A0A2P2NV24_RHIMU